MESECRLQSHGVEVAQRRCRTRARISFGGFSSMLLCLTIILGFCGTSQALATPWRILDGSTRNLARDEAQIQGRQDPLSGSESSSAAASTTAEASATSTGHDSSSTSAAASGSGTSTSILPTLTARPKVFDAGLGSNFSSNSCPQFLQGLNNDDSFTNCLPLSLLLQQSNSFFDESSTSDGLTAILDLTCNVVFPSCQSLMANLADQLLDSANCGDDYDKRNPIVMTAYYGFISYTPLYQAGCLKASASSESSVSSQNPSSTSDSTSSNEYCFVAAANSSQPADSYVYSLPLGNALPGSSRPTCSACLQQTMAFFATAATNATNPLSDDYVDAATQINSGCGPTFVANHITINPDTESAGSPTAQLGVGSMAMAALVSWLVMLS